MARSDFSMESVVPKAVEMKVTGLYACKTVNFFPWISVFVYLLLLFLILPCLVSSVNHRNITSANNLDNQTLNATVSALWRDGRNVQEVQYSIGTKYTIM